MGDIRMVGIFAWRISSIFLQSIHIRNEEKSYFDRKRTLEGIIEGDKSKKKKRTPVGIFRNNFFLYFSPNCFAKKETYPPFPFVRALFFLLFFSNSFQ